MTPLQNKIHDKLTAAFSPSSLDVINDSHKHKGHGGSPDTGDSHFTIKISAPELADLSRVACHQRIYKVLDDEFKQGLHALSIIVIPKRPRTSSIVPKL